MTPLETNLRLLARPVDELEELWGENFVPLVIEKLNSFGLETAHEFISDYRSDMHLNVGFADIDLALVIEFTTHGVSNIFDGAPKGQFAVADMTVYLMSADANFRYPQHETYRHMRDEYPYASKVLSFDMFAEDAVRALKNSLVQDRTFIEQSLEPEIEYLKSLHANFKNFKSEDRQKRTIEAKQKAFDISQKQKWLSDLGRLEDALS